VKRHSAFKRHILTKKATGRKRGLRKAVLVSDADTPNVRRMLLG
jgi:ribosomal protein L35